MAAPLKTPTAPCGKNPPGLRDGSAGRVRLRASPCRNPMPMMNRMNATCTAVSTMFTTELSLVLCYSNGGGGKNKTILQTLLQSKFDPHLSTAFGVIKTFHHVTKRRVLQHWKTQRPTRFLATEQNLHLKDPLQPEGSKMIEEESVVHSLSSCHCPLLTQTAE